MYHVLIISDVSNVVTKEGFLEFHNEANYPKSQKLVDSIQAISSSTS